MSFFKRHKNVDEHDTEYDNDDNIDPELRLRTVRTAASAIAESIKSEQRAERRKSRHRGFFRRHGAAKKTVKPVPSTEGLVPSKVVGTRRNVHVNHPLSAMEVDRDGEPTARYVRNKVRTTSVYPSALYYLSILIRSQNIRSYHLYPRICTSSFDGEPLIIGTVVQSLMSTCSVANLFFLSLVILQRERQ